MWNTPFEQALSISVEATLSAEAAASLSLASTAASTFFVYVLIADLIDLFLSAFVSLTMILYLADLMLANLSTSI